MFFIQGSQSASTNRCLALDRGKLLFSIKIEVLRKSLGHVNATIEDLLYFLALWVSEFQKYSRF
jgi:hypothetical protein